MPPKVKSIRFFSLSVLEPKNTSVCLICFELLQLQETHMLHTCSSTFLLFSLCSQLISFDGFMVSCDIYTQYIYIETEGNADLELLQSTTYWGLILCFS